METFNQKININEITCVRSCLDAGQNKYEYNNVCYNKCPAGTLMIDLNCIDKNCDDSSENHIECEDDKPLGFYLDPNDGVYKKCYETCKFCEGPGNAENHNCLECNSGFRFIPEFENDKNCYQNCKYYYLDESNTIHCISDETCPSPYNILIPQKGKCIDQCKNDNIYKYDYHGTCSDKLIEETTNIPIETTVNNIMETTINN